MLNASKLRLAISGMTLIMSVTICSGVFMLLSPEF
jgi:hypothetical protein